MNQEFDVVVTQKVGDIETTTYYKKYTDYLKDKIHNTEGLDAARVDFDFSGMIRLGENNGK